MIHGPSGRNDSEADDDQHAEQRFDNTKLSAEVGGKQRSGYGHDKKADSANQRNHPAKHKQAEMIQALSMGFLIQLKSSPAEER